MMDILGLQPPTRWTRSKHTNTPRQWYVDHIAGQWFFFNEATDYKMTPLANFDQGSAPAVSPQFIFENESTVSRLLTCDDPELAGVASYVRMARKQGSMFAADTAQLDAFHRLASSILHVPEGPSPSGLPSWIWRETHAHVELTLGGYVPEFAHAALGVPNFLYRDVLDDDFQCLWFQRALAHQQKLVRFMAGERSPELSELFVARSDLAEAMSDWIRGGDSLSYNFLVSESCPLAVVSEKQVYVPILGRWEQRPMNIPWDVLCAQ